MKHAADASFTNLETAIRAAGARVTSPRLRVLGMLREARAPATHRDIEEALGREPLPKLDRVTLYRVLDWLAANGLAHKAADAHGVFRFSAAAAGGEHRDHVHFRCTGCGGVQCLNMKLPKPPALPKGYRLTGMEFDIRGECPGCAAKHRRP